MFEDQFLAFENKSVNCIVDKTTRQFLHDSIKSFINTVLLKRRNTVLLNDITHNSFSHCVDIKIVGIVNILSKHDSMATIDLKMYNSKSNIWTHWRMHIGCIWCHLFVQENPICFEVSIENGLPHTKLVYIFIPVPSTWLYVHHRFPNIQIINEIFEHGV